MDKARIAVLVSGNGSNLQALMDAAKAPDYPAKIVLVIANKADAYALARAQKEAVPTAIISHKDYSSREAFDMAMHAKLMEHNVHIVCLAGFMRLLTPAFVQLWERRMLNIHPSLLPKFKGVNAVIQALEAGEKVAGCTVHFVTAEMDAGPIIAQHEVPITEGDTPESLQQRIHTAEHRLYPAALKQVVEQYL